MTKDISTPATDEEIKIGEQIASYSIMLGDSISTGLGAKWSKVSYRRFWSSRANRQFEGYEVAMVDGHIAFSAGSTVPVVEGLNVILPPREVKPEAEAEQPTATITEIGEAKPEGPEAMGEDVVVKEEPIELEIQEVQAKALIKPVKAEVKSSFLPGSLFVGDLRLANLKARLSALTPPIPAEFAGEGVLICGPGVNKGSSAKGGSVVAVRKLGEGQIVLEGGIGRTYETVRKELYKGFARVVAA